MRLLIVIPHFMIGGAQRLLSDLVPLMARRDDLDITIALYQNPEGAMMMRPILRNPMVKIRVLNIPLSHKAFLNPLIRRRAISGLRDLMKEADVCHVHLFPALYDAALAARGLPVRLIFTNHNTTNRRRRYPLLRPLERLIYSRYDALACISPASARSLSAWLSLHPTDERLSIIPNGINSDIFNFHSRANDSFDSSVIPPDDNTDFLTSFAVGPDLDRRRRMERAGIRNEEEVFGRKGHAVLMISRFVDNKDQDSLIRAFSILKHDPGYADLIPADTFIVFVGSGPRIEICRRLAREYGVADDVAFLGDRHDLPRLIAAASVGCQISHWEGFGLTACEIMAGELPLIASNVSGMGDLVKEGATLVAPENPEEIARAIADILAPVSPDAFNDLLLRQAAGRRIADRHHIRHTLERYMDLYHKLTK